MKSRWLIAVLIGSLALNLAAVGAFAYHRYRKWRRRDWAVHRLRVLAPDKVGRLFEEHRLKMDSLRFDYWQARYELAKLILEERPDSARVETLLNRIGDIHREMNRLVFQTASRAGDFVPPDFRERARRRWCEMMGCPHPPRPEKRIGPGPRLPGRPRRF